MLTFLERTIAAIEQRLVILMPGAQAPSDEFKNVTVDTTQYRQLLRNVQQLRGSVYLRDGAIRKQELSPEGLHETPEDERSWHLVILGNDGTVEACSWYLEHQTPLVPQQLRVQSCPLFSHPDWRERVERAIDLEMRHARRERVGYCEVGGWATSQAGRCSPEGVLLVPATFGFSRLLGGALGLATATARHSSASILKRLGFSPLESDGGDVPAYFDPRYNCDMELLRFDTRRSSPRYEHLIERLKERLTEVCVFTPARASVPSKVLVEAAA